MTLENICTILRSVLPDKVFYGTNVYDDEDNASMPYIVYQEISKRAIGYGDNLPLAFSSKIQITLVTKKKDLSLERNLEKALLDNEISFELTSEFFNSDKSINRIYQINMEEI